MQPTAEEETDTEMKVQETQSEINSLDLEHYRHLVRTFIDMVGIIW